VKFQDYLNGSEKNLATGDKQSLPFPASNVLMFYLEDGSQIAARPSGTEPKIKFYVSVNQQITRKDELADAENHLQGKIMAILSDLGVEQ
jgi:phosphomannomutase